ncbi:MAG: LemA family protein [Clostridia bacterium]|nr:LemA family protein [Clostridia bacterium]
MTILLIIIGVLLVLIFVIVGIYNSLVQSKLRVDNAWAQIDTQLKRRFDLIPNLVETVKAYAVYEAATLEKIVEARNSYTSATDEASKAQADGLLSNSLKNIFALAENYPELKANENFLGLQQELSSAEDKIAYSRQFYNDAVQMYNAQVLSFPKNVIAGIFGFKQKAFFEVRDETQRDAVKVQF